MSIVQKLSSDDLPAPVLGSGRMPRSASGLSASPTTRPGVAFHSHLAWTPEPSPDPLLSGTGKPRPIPIRQ